MIKNFDLTGWEMFSDRRNSQSYYNADKTKMVKFNTGVADSSLESFEKEKEMVDKAISIGIKTPKAYEIAQLPDGRYGIVYQYIEGKKSIARAISQNLDKLDHYIGRFVKSAKEFHKCKCDTTNTVSWEERILNQINNFPFLNDEQKKKANELIDKTEKKNNAILGDFHTGNFIITDTEEFVIDLVSLSYGNPIWDMSMFYWFTSVFPQVITEHIFHCEKEYQLKMWDSFVKQYFGYNDEETDKFTKAIKKYSMISFFGMLNFIKPSPEDIPMLKRMYDDEFDKAYENKDVLNI